VFRALRSLSKADRDDIIAATLKQLFLVVRGDRISGSTNAEIHAYVRTAIRNEALDLLRSRTRSAEVEEARLWASPDGETTKREMADERPTQDAQVLVSEELRRAHDLLQSWSAADRYLFFAKIQGVPARVIQQALARPPFNLTIAVTTVDTRFHRLRRSLIDRLGRT